MTIGNIGHQPSPFKWINEGWAALKERAHSAITHFAPTDESSTSGDKEVGGSWGVMAADVVARDGEIEVRFEMPGMEKEDIEVSVRNGRIIVQGEKHVSDRFQDGDLVVTERAFGRFQRALVLPAAVHAEQATARYKNGVLTVKIPRVEQSGGAGRIAIK